MTTSSDVSPTAIADLLEQGTRAFALSDWDAAIEHFGQMAELTETSVGPDSPAYAEALVMYGRALLQHAIEQNALMAQKTLADAALGIAPQESGDQGGSGVQEDDDDATAAATLQKKSKITFEGEPDFRHLEQEDQEQAGKGKGKGKEADTEAEDDGEDDDEEADGEAEDVDDFAAAWDILDLARVIQARASDRRSQMKYAETLMLLGDVSMESENFAQALTDYTEALHVKEQFLEDDSRELAEIYYKVALASEYSQDTARALDLMKDVERILTNRINGLPDDKVSTDERVSLEEVLGDVRGKIEEWKLPRVDVGLADVLGGAEERALAERAREVFAKALEDGTINDISGLVKSKKTKRRDSDVGGQDVAVQEKDEGASDLAKKQKIDE
ncbi:hypothetical protein LPJ53_004538 [Coemansia erecta]|uniref:Tetratricopeptide SHNi-TPR domain-containing protein n=1 Tax=Coemansia erecta TaxID=147472 RepID=A0A9W8CQS8_9FUNG|nr:hypothetical protein LPJ53_004538 [Coemansia erecta]